MRALCLILLVRRAAGEQMLIDVDPVEPNQRALRSVKRGGSEWATNSAALKADLLANYPEKSNIAPPLTEPVSVQFKPISINDIDTVGHTFSIYGWWRIWWSDERLAWNASEYGGVDSIYFTGSKAEGERRIWMPDLGVYESVGGPLSTVQDISIRALPDGSLYICQPSIYTVPCGYDHIERDFPFDENKCGGVNSFTYGSWAHGSEVMSLRPATGGQGDRATRAERASLQADSTADPLPVQCDEFTQRVDYKLKRINVVFSVQTYGSADVVDPVSYPTLAFEFVLVRSTASSSGRINVGIVWPLILTCLLSIVVQCAPEDRVSTGVTCLLAESALYLVVASSLSEPGRISQLFFNFFVITFLATICGLLSTLMNNAVNDIDWKKLPEEEKTDLLARIVGHVMKARRMKGRVQAVAELVQQRLRSPSVETAQVVPIDGSEGVPQGEMDAPSTSGETDGPGTTGRETSSQRRLSTQRSSLSDGAVRDRIQRCIEMLPMLREHTWLLNCCVFFVLLLSLMVFCVQWFAWRDEYMSKNYKWLCDPHEQGCNRNALPHIVYSESM